MGAPREARRRRGGGGAVHGPIPTAIRPRPGKVGAVALVPVSQGRSLRHSGCAHLRRSRSPVLRPGSQPWSRGGLVPSEEASGWRRAFRTPGDTWLLQAAHQPNQPRSWTPIPLPATPLLPGMQVQRPTCFTGGIWVPFAGGPPCAGDGGRGAGRLFLEDEPGITSCRRFVQWLRCRGPFPCVSPKHCTHAC